MKVERIGICIPTREHLLRPEQVQRNNEVVHLHDPVQLQTTAEGKKIANHPLMKTTLVNSECKDI